MLENFFKATECSQITVILGIAIVGLLVVIGRLYFRNIKLSNHIMGSDKNNAVIMTELNGSMKEILNDDKVNADKILTAIKNLNDNVKNSKK